MLNRKVYKLLLLLEEEERQAFAQYLDSSLFGASKTIARFYQIWLHKVLSPGKEPLGNLTVEEFLKDSGLRPSRMDKYCSQLYQKVLGFMALQEYLEAKQDQLKKAAEGLERRNAPAKTWEAQQQRLGTAIDALPDSSDKAWQALQYKWKVAEKRSHSRETPNIWKEDFQELHVSLDQYYYLQKLKLACASINAHFIYNHEHAERHQEELAFLHDIPKERLPPLTKAYWYTFRIYTDPEFPFQPLFDLLQQASDRFSDEEALEIFGYALNYCVRRATKGEFRFKQYTAAIYRELLNKGILLVDEKLPPPMMKNIVIVHCVVGELDWVEDFLAGYRDRLREGSDPHHITYNEAILAIFRRQYPQAISKFKQVISHLKNDIFYELDARTNLLIAYFEHREQLELDEVDDMYRLLESCRFFIERNQKISQVHKLKYGNFLRMFRRLLKLIEATPVSAEKMKQFHTEVKETQLLVSKNWLEEKAKPFLEPVSGGDPQP